jgi:hypothetical protein
MSFDRTFYPGSWLIEVTLKKCYNAKVVAEMTYSHRPFFGFIPVRPRAAGESPYTRIAT